MVGQPAVAAKSKEIPCVRELIACFDLSGAVVMVDAMHTTAVAGRAGPLGHRHQPRSARHPRHQDHDRTDLDRFPGAAQVAQIRRTVSKNSKKSVEVVYLITAADAPPAALAA